MCASRRTTSASRTRATGQRPRLCPNRRRRPARRTVGKRSSQDGAPTRPQGRSVRLDAVSTRASCGRQSKRVSRRRPRSCNSRKSDTSALGEDCSEPDRPGCSSGVTRVAWLPLERTRGDPRCPRRASLHRRYRRPRSCRGLRWRLRRSSSRCRTAGTARGRSSTSRRTTGTPTKEHSLSMASRSVGCRRERVRLGLRGRRCRDRWPRPGIAATIVTEPVRQPWGCTGAFADPGGYLWRVTSRPAR